MVSGFLRNWFGCSEIGFGFMGFYELGNNAHPLSLARSHCSQKSNSSFCHRTFGLRSPLGILAEAEFDSVAGLAADGWVFANHIH
ncbi:unnamed protein product [Prunus armeniaca]